MALSANAAKALEQVKMGLFMLYGADYFTEDEWIKIDGLIHKGQYVFTQGPSAIRNVLEEELMSFDDSKEITTTLNVQTEALDTFELIEKEPAQVSEEQVPSPISADSTASPSETPNATSAEVSSDEESAPTQPSTKNGSAMHDLSEMTTPGPEETTGDLGVKERSSSNGGLALGYTQAQLEEVKAFNAGLTKAGEKKKRPKYSKVEDSFSEHEDPSELAEDPFEPPTPAPTHQEIRSWADQVNDLGSATPEPASVISEPAAASPKEAQSNSWTVTPKVSTPGLIPKELLVEQFVLAHGKPPRSVNDVLQPNNPEFRPKRPDSRMSMKTTKTFTSKPKSVASVARAKPKALPQTSPKLKVDAGTVLIAQRSCQKISNMGVDVLTGDQIKVLKYISSDKHLGVNLRTKEQGQFSESIFKKNPAGIIERQQEIIKQTEAATVRHQRMASVSTTVSKKLDKFEIINAAEWDEVPVTRPKTVAPAPIRPSLGGLTASRFAVIADADSKSESSSLPEATQGMTREEVDRLVDEKFEQILKARNMENNNSPKPPTGPRNRTIGKEPLKPVEPKKNMCWFWATPNKGCRFTTEECRDLHEIIPTGPGEPTNLRAGKPTWGALADATSSPKAGMTCCFWATSGNCVNGGKCKYLHEPGTLGVAPQPRKHWGTKNSDWSRWTDKENGSVNGWGETETEVGDDELVLEEVRGWGDGDKYKPPHIKALEEQAKTAVCGW